MRVSLALLLRGIHLRPRNLVFYQGSYLLSCEAVRRLIWRSLGVHHGATYYRWLRTSGTKTLSTRTGDIERIYLCLATPQPILFRLDSGLEAFSHNLEGDSLAALAFQPAA
jgi:hypothetical protein